MEDSIEPQISTASGLERLAHERDPQAWVALLHAHGSEIQALASRITGDPVLCEDICQETLLQIIENAHRFQPTLADPEASARGWIMRVACCTALKMLRSRNRLLQHETRAGAEKTVVASAASEVAISREQAERVRCEVAKLPESLREPLSLRFFAALEFPAIATALGCSQDAARKRVQRGLDLLRTRLAACGIAISAGAVTCALSATPAHAASVGMLAATTQHALNSQQLTAWQGLLNGPSTSVAKLAMSGGLAAKAKIGLGVAALVFLVIGGAKAMRANAPRMEVPATLAKVAANGGNNLSPGKSSNAKVSLGRFCLPGVVEGLIRNGILIETGSRNGIKVFDSATDVKIPFGITQAIVMRNQEDGTETARVHFNDNQSVIVPFGKFAYTPVVNAKLDAKAIAKIVPPITAFSIDEIVQLQLLKKSETKLVKGQEVSEFHVDPRVKLPWGVTGVIVRTNVDGATAVTSLMIDGREVGARTADIPEQF